MVLQKAVDSMKERPKDERKAVAGGIAVAVVATLLVAWILLFFKNLQHSGANLKLGGTAQDEFNFSSARETQQRIMYGTASSTAGEER